MKKGQKVSFVTKTDGNIPFGTKGTLKDIFGMDDTTALVKFPKIGTWVVGLNEIELVTKTKSKGKKK